MTSNPNAVARANHRTAAARDLTFPKKADSLSQRLHGDYAIAGSTLQDVVDHLHVSFPTYLPTN